jgi:hypothetical protein
MKRYGYVNRHALIARMVNMTGDNDWEHVALEVAKQILTEHAIERFKARQREAGERDGR